MMICIHLAEDARTEEGEVGCADEERHVDLLATAEDGMENELLPSYPIISRRKHTAHQTLMTMAPIPAPVQPR